MEPGSLTLICSHQRRIQGKSERADPMGDGGSKGRERGTRGRGTLTSNPRAGGTSDSNTAKSVKLCPPLYKFEKGVIQGSLPNPRVLDLQNIGFRPVAHKS